MKTILLLLLLTSSSLYSQTTVGLGFRLAPYYSSLGKFMNENHLINDGALPIHDSRTYLKYGLGADYTFRESKEIFHQVQLTVGHRHIKEYYEDIYVAEGTNDESGWIESLKYNQLSYVLNYLFGGKISAGRMKVSAALGGSLQRIGKGHQTWYRHNYSDPEYYEGSYETTESEITIGGGWGIGMVSQIEFSLKLNERLSIAASINNYLSFLVFSEHDHVKGTFESSPGSILQSSSWDNKIKNDHYRIAASRIAPGFLLKYTFN